MLNKPKVSILVPVYNVEKYLSDFLKSLMNQTLKQIEIIIVNDCSPDKCGLIISEFLKDTRIKYINKKENEGLWKARQSAFEISTGEFIINLDPDDIIDLDYLEKLYTLGKKENLDFVLSNVTIINENSKVLKKKQLPNHYDNYIFKKDSDYKILLGTAYATWFRLINKDFLSSQNYSYLNGELALFSYQFCEGVKVGIDTSVSYYYRKHSTSLSNYNNSSKRLSQTNEFDMESLHKKIAVINSLNIPNSNKKEILNIYTYRVFYSLLIISWLHYLPKKQLRIKLSQFLKSNLNFNPWTYMKHIRFFKKSDAIFLTLCLFKMEKLVYWKLKNNMNKN